MLLTVTARSHHLSGLRKFGKPYFLRYWRSWISLHPTCSLEKNFITSNAFKRVELNTHALIIALAVARDTFEGKRCFLFWLLGSQCCEQAFWAIRKYDWSFFYNDKFWLLRHLH